MDEVIMVNGAEHDRPASGRGYLYQLAAGAGWASLPFLPLIRQPPRSWPAPTTQHPTG